MPLYAVLARDYFGARVMGTVFGAASMSPASAWRRDRRLAAGSSTSSYAGMHLSSLAIGLGAVAIALTFPPLPRLRPERLKPA